jgi:hypothetical protein
MASLTPYDPDYQRSNMKAFRGILGKIIFIDFLRAQGAIPGFFKTAQDNEKFKDKNKEFNDLIMYFVMLFMAQQYQLQVANSLKAIKLALKQLLAKMYQRLRAYRKRIRQEAIADDDLEEQQRLQAELALIESAMPIIEKNPTLPALWQTSSSCVYANSQQHPTDIEQQHFYTMRKSLGKILSNSNKKYRRKSTSVNAHQAETSDLFTQKLSMVC